MCLFYFLPQDFGIDRNLSEKLMDIESLTPAARGSLEKVGVGTIHSLVIGVFEGSPSTSDVFSGVSSFIKALTFWREKHQKEKETKA